jgi:hypothetical protein
MKGYGKMLEERNKDDRKINQNIQSMWLNKQMQEKFG